MAALAEIPPRPDTPRGVEPVLRRGPDRDWIYRYRTRWKDPVSGRRVPAEFDTIEMVLDFRAHLRVARARGEVVQLVRGNRSLDAFFDGDYWPRYAMRHLARNTRDSYISVYNNHLRPHLGPVRLRHFNAPRVRDLRDTLLDGGASPTTVRRAMVLLQGICTQAIEAGDLERNPVRDVLKPSIERKLAIVAPGPLQIEALRAELDLEGAALVALIGIEGLRPSEALALADTHLGLSTILVERHLDHGDIVPGLKTHRGRERSYRSPKLFDAVRDDVEAYLAERGGRRGLLFRGRDGGPWSPSEYRRWREKEFLPAVERAGIELGRIYDLRHGCASLLLHADWPLDRISQHMGHTVSTLSAYYSHVIEDLRDQDPVDVDAQISAARTSRGDAMRQST